MTFSKLKKFRTRYLDHARNFYYKSKTFLTAKMVLGFALIGGPEEIRTLGLRVANAALYQLSYEPEYSVDF